MVASVACTADHVLGELTSPFVAVGSPCGAFVAGDDFPICAATYLSGKGNEPTAAVAIGADRAVVVGGSMEGQDLGATTTSFPVKGTGVGTVVRLRADGREVLSVSRLGDNLLDLKVAPTTGSIVVLGTPFGVAALSADAKTLLWQKPQAGVRLAVAPDGLVAVLETSPAQVTLLDARGAPLLRFPVPGDGVVPSDIAVHGPTQTIIVTGQQPAGATPQPLLLGLDFKGNVKWRNYAWSENELRAKNLVASTRGVRVVLGADDRLYYVGESHGGNTTHGKDPRDLAVNASVQSQDAYDSPYDTAQYILFWGRFRPDDGRFEGGEFLLARAMMKGPGGTGASVHPESIAADEKGNVIVGGTLDCCVQGYSRKTLRGVSVAPGDSDAFVTLFTADGRRRLAWTTFGAPATSNGVALRAGVGAVVSLQPRASSDKARLFTVDAVQAAPGGGDSDIHLVVFPAP